MKNCPPLISYLRVIYITPTTTGGDLGGLKRSSEILGVKMEIFPKHGHSKIWSAKSFSAPPNSAPSLRQCLHLNILYVSATTIGIYCLGIYFQNSSSTPYYTLQKRIIRVVCKLPYLANTKSCFIKLNVLTLET